MVDLPTVGNGIVTSQAPQSAITAAHIERRAGDEAGVLKKGADALMQVSSDLAREQAGEDLKNQKIVRDADGNVKVENPASAPLIFGDAGRVYHEAVFAGTAAQHANETSSVMTELHAKNPTDPAAFKAAAEAWRDKTLQNVDGLMGEAVRRQSD